MNEEMKEAENMTQKESEDHSNIHGHPHGMKNPEDLKKVIAEFDEAIAYHEKKKEIMKKQLTLIAEFPTPLNPTFEYETKAEWIELLKEQHSINLEPKLMEAQEDIRTTKDRREVYVEMLRTDVEESEAKKDLQALMIKKRLEKEMAKGDEKDGN
jgi:hypothetical protein